MPFQHEWAAHGTCYDTLEPSCLPSGSPTGAEAVAFFEQTVALFQTLPTYDWLESQGITPSDTKTYTLSQLNEALSAASGVRYHTASPMTTHRTNYVYTVHPKPWLP
jgi:ribonuclease T2